MKKERDEIDNEDDVEPESGENVSYHAKQPRKPYSKLATELSDDDLASPGVQKMLLAEISRLESVVHSGEEAKENYHTIDKECAVLKEKSKTFVFSEIIYSLSLTLGAAIIGFTPSLKSDSFPTYIITVIGGLLVVGAVLAKVVKK